MRHLPGDFTSFVKTTLCHVLFLFVRTVSDFPSGPGAHSTSNIRGNSSHNTIQIFHNKTFHSFELVGLLNDALDHGAAHKSRKLLHDAREVDACTVNTPTPSNQKPEDSCRTRLQFRHVGRAVISPVVASPFLDSEFSEHQVNN